MELPKERNVVTQTKPENITISINKDGDMFWGMEYVRDTNALFNKLKVVAVQNPQPEIHVRADENARYEFVGRVVATCQRASILKIGFITEPPARVL
jgi:biopolymer transport protein ExbD